MGTAEYIASAGVVASIVGALVTWLVMRRQFASKKLSYSYSIESILNRTEPDLAHDLKVYYKGNELPEPTLMSLKIVNTGLSAIENAEVVVQLPGATYLIPGYFVNVPAGYLMLWDIDRTDAEECTIRFKHINPKQVANIRLLMDERPDGEPRISCPMPNVECTKAGPAKLGVLAELLLEAFNPELLGIIRSK